MNRVKNQELAYLAYVQRENQFIHHTFDDENQIYDLICRGDSAAIPLGLAKYTGPHNGTLSQNALRNKQYHFVVETALTARACIRGGMPYQDAYGLSDLYIQKADECRSIPQLNELYTEMVSDYIRRISVLKQQDIDSKPVKQCIDYIYTHLHEKITVSVLARQVNRNPSYLSALFKKTMNCSISSYIRTQKLNTAKNMLKYSDFSYAEICSILALGSQSHFTELLKTDCGMTPHQYRNHFYENGT